MRFKTLFLSTFLLLGCDPAVRTARVKPDHSVDLILHQSQKVRADVYLNQDKKVELQIFNSSGTGSPTLSGLVVNNRQEELTVDLSKAFLVFLDGERGKPCSIWFEGCTSSPDQRCDVRVFELKPSQSKEIHLGCSARAEFHLPILASGGDGSDEIVAKFKLCKVSGIGRSCETVH